MRHNVKRTISLPPLHDRVLKELADESFGGNVSATVQRLFESHPVTKSRFPLAKKATAGRR